MKLAICTCESYPGLPGVESSLPAQFAAAGAEVHVFDWRCWSAFVAEHGLPEAVVIRSPWDYYKHYEEFMAWIAAVENAGVLLVNPGCVIRWNSDKHYLLTMRDRFGIGIVPTFPADADVPVPYVVKPFVSASSFHTAAIRTADEEKAMHDELVSWGVFSHPEDYLKQPFVEEFCSIGEFSLFYFAGKLSHVCLKKPKEGDFRVQPEFGSTISGLPASETPKEALEAGQRCFDAVAKLCAEDWKLPVAQLPYFRVDLVLRRKTDNQPGFDALLGELELIEPYLYFEYSPSCAEHQQMYVRAVVDYISRARMTE
jgi:hypothetical protein